MNKLNNELRSLLSRRFLKKPSPLLYERLLGGTFPKDSKHKILIYYYPNAICWSLIYPYFYYLKEFANRYNAHIRTLPVTQFLSSSVKLPEADTIIVQPWFTENEEKLSAALSSFRLSHPQTQLIFLDSFAHTDLRLGHSINPYIDVYLRKALFRNRTDFLKPFAGDTNLTEYYSQLYGIDAKPVERNVPNALLPKLGLAPNFLTAPYLIKGFMGSEPDFSQRPIDVHSRIAIKGSPWYTAMRTHADNAIRTITGISHTPDGRIPRDKFLSEMRSSKLCWSPFGYGELCWRDLEAFLTGAVLIKPDMSHLDTTPNLYKPGETYLPVKWDFSDLEPVVRKALDNPEYREQIALNAFRACKEYLDNAVFVDETAKQLKLI